MLTGLTKYSHILSCRPYRCSYGVTNTIQRRHSSSTRNLPNEADVVVIGGGAIGTSTLYHLALEGVKNAILLEKDQITAGTTWHSAGLLWRLRPNDTEIQLIDRTRELVKSDGILSSETGQTCGWNSNGGLFIASNEERLNEYKRLQTIGRYFDIESHVLSASESKELYPLMNIDDVYGTLYSPGDGTVEPAEYVTTLARAAKQRGAKIFENVCVDKIDSEGGEKKVKGVITSNGDYIRTNQVVICGGVWSRDFGLKNNVNIPLCAMKHAYVLTDSIPGIRSMPCIRDHDLSIYLRVQGECLQVGGYEANPIFWDEVDEAFAFSLFDLDYDSFSVHLENGMRRVPIIEEIGIKSEVCGPESFTSDHKPLLGPLYNDKSLFVSAGFNSAGIMLSGGCGQQLAKWMVNGYPDLDMFGYDVNRFHESMTANTEWIKERSHESYAKNYSIVFPMDEPLASRNMRVSPCHSQLLENGCFFQERHGYERPGWFTQNTRDTCTGPLQYDYYGEYGNRRHAEYKYGALLESEYSFDFATNHGVIGEEVDACRNAVVLFDQSYFGKFYVKGRDAVEAMQFICSNNVDRVVGSSIYTAMCNESGRVECDLAVHRIDADEYYITAGGLTCSRDYKHIDYWIQKKGFDCALVDKSDEFAMLSVQGPRSRDLLYDLLSEEDRNREILSNESFPFSSHKMVNVIAMGHHQVRAIRLTFVGEMGWELHVPSHSAQDIYQSLLRKGEKYAIRNSGYRAIDSLSLQKGYLHWHQDIGLADTPLEAGIGFVVPKTKLNDENVEFVGKQALLAQKSEGVKKRLVHVSINNKLIRLNGLETIWRGGVCVGYLRSASYDYMLRQSIGSGYLIHHEKKGDVVTPKYIRGDGDPDPVQYEIEVMGQRYPCHVTTKAQFDPKNERIHGNYMLAEQMI